jgi:tetratricopeptide (TPR) repeat protein
VLGQRYGLDALRHLIEDDRYDCRLLADHFLVRADGGEFMFCHALIRDGVYASLLHKRRRALHARAGEWFARDDISLAAEHFERAEDGRAAPSYLKASEAAAAQFRHSAALALVERGLALAAEQGTRFALLMMRGRLLVELGRSGEAIDACRTALETAASDGERATAMIAMAAGMRLNDRISEGLATLEEAQPLAEAAGLALELSRLHHLRGNLLFPRGRAAECLAEHERARQQARAAGSLEAEAAAMGGLGDAHYLHGRMRSANQQFRACAALARQHGFGRLEVANLSMIGWSGIHLAEVGEAVARGLEAIELATRASQPRAEILARALVHTVEGRTRLHLDEAERQAAPALQLIRSLGAKRFEAQTLAVNAVIQLHRRDRGAAREHADQALAICREHEHARSQAGPFVHGVCALVETDRATRLGLLEEGARQLALGCVSHNHLQLPELAIDVLLEIGDWEGVDRHCQRIRSYTAGEALALADFIADRGEALARLGRGDRGQVLRSTLADLHALGARLELNSFLPALEQALERLGSPVAPTPRG